MMRIIILLALLFISGCLNSFKMYEVIKQDGVESAQITNRSLFGCSKDDRISMNFTGVKNNKPVTGVICGDFLKGYTLRYF